jgi:hypothetical protein
MRWTTLSSITALACVERPLLTSGEVMAMLRRAAAISSAVIVGSA